MRLLGVGSTGRVRYNWGWGDGLRGGGGLGGGRLGCGFERGHQGDAPLHFTYRVLGVGDWYHFYVLMAYLIVPVSKTKDLNSLSE